MADRVRAFLLTWGFWLVYFWIARALFLGYHHAATAGLPSGDLLGIWVHGFRLDASGAAYLTAFPAILLVVSTLPGIRRAVPGLLWLWTGAAAVLCGFLIAADLELYRHWDRRIDGEVVRYLATPAEAWASTGGTPRFPLILLAVGLAAATVVGFGRWVMPVWRRFEPVKPPWAIPSVLFLGLLLVAGRGGFQEIPLTPSAAYFSRRPFANDAAGNAPWGFFNSLVLRVDDHRNPWRALEPDSARAAVAAATAPAGPPAPAPLATTRPNLLLILWESAAAGAFGSLGGPPGVTPRFDSLARDGILFRRLYAAGDRTDEGIAAVLSGFPAPPRGSILKVPRKAGSLPMVARDLAAAGYSTSFFYGGELEFASLQAYLVQAGFDRVVGKGDFPRASWSSKWGAHDGVVAERLLASLDSATAPFFSVWLTLSSHEPFETPVAPRIPGTDWRARYLGSMAYTDQVLGDLIAAARTRSWWASTLVVIVADHGRRVAARDEDAPPPGDDRLFHVPMLWLGGALTARDSVVDRVGSQTDIAPTLLALTGVTPERPYPWGHSLLQPTSLPFAYYGFETGFGLVTDRGALVYDDRARSIRSRTGPVTPEDERLGRALLQLTYQDYLDR